MSTFQKKHKKLYDKMNQIVIPPPSEWELESEDEFAKFKFIIAAYVAVDILIDKDDDLYDEAYKQAERAALYSQKYYSSNGFSKDVTDFYSYLGVRNYNFARLLARAI